MQGATPIGSLLLSQKTFFRALLESRLPINYRCAAEDKKLVNGSDGRIVRAIFDTTRLEWIIIARMA